MALRGQGCSLRPLVFWTERAAFFISIAGISIGPAVSHSLADAELSARNRGPGYNSLHGFPGTSNRREFLRGQAAVRALSNLAQSAVGDQPEAETEPAAEPYVVQIERWAMACDFELYLNAGQYAEATEIGLQALDLVEALEAQLTVYRDTSELMQINRSAAEGPVVVEPRLFALLALAQSFSRETQGSVRHHVRSAVESLGLSIVVQAASLTKTNCKLPWQTSAASRSNWIRRPLPCVLCSLAWN